MSLCVPHDIIFSFIASTLKLLTFKNNYLELDHRIRGIEETIIFLNYKYIRTWSLKYNSVGRGYRPPSILTF